MFVCKCLCPCICVFPGLFTLALFFLFVCLFVLPYSIYFVVFILFCFIYFVLGACLSSNERENKSVWIWGIGGGKPWLEYIIWKNISNLCVCVCVRARVHVCVSTVFTGLVYGAQKTTFMILGLGESSSGSQACMASAFTPQPSCSPTGLGSLHLKFFPNF